MDFFFQFFFCQGYVWAFLQVFANIFFHDYVRLSARVDPGGGGGENQWEIKICLGFEKGDRRKIKPV